MAFPRLRAILRKPCEAEARRSRQTMSQRRHASLQFAAPSLKPLHGTDRAGTALANGCFRLPRRRPCFLSTNCQPIDLEAMRAKLSDSGCSSSSCGSSDKPSDMAPAIWEKIKDHPCYSEEAHHYFARMHVAVAPACNIQCNYCNRKYDCANESRPGVVSEKLTPGQARRKVVAVANEVPQLSVLGIAGPGDACYDWSKSKATFERDRRRDSRHQAVHLDQRPRCCRTMSTNWRR